MTLKEHLSPIVKHRGVKYFFTRLDPDLSFRADYSGFPDEFFFAPPHPAAVRAGYNASSVPILQLAWRETVCRNPSSTISARPFFRTQPATMAGARARSYGGKPRQVHVDLDHSNAPKAFWE